jgi:hypothetical protein
VKEGFKWEDSCEEFVNLTEEITIGNEDKIDHDEQLKIDAKQKEEDERRRQEAEAKEREDQQRRQ